MPDRFVLDASALLCLLNGEEGSERVAAVFDNSIISAVNYSEVIAKIVERGGSLDMVEASSIFCTYGSWSSTARKPCEREP